MTIKNRRRVVHYRKAEFEPHDAIFANCVETRTLEEMLRTAVQCLEAQGKELVFRRDNERTEALSLVNGMLPCSTGFDFPSSALFTVRPGDCVAAVATDNYGMRITSAHAQDPESGKKLDPARDITIFAVKGNHLAYISTVKNADGRLVEFFSWILQRMTRTLDTMFFLRLNSCFTAKAREKLDKVGIKKILMSTRRVSSADGGIINEAKRVTLDAIILPQSSIIRRQALEECEYELIIRPGSKNAGIRQDAMRYYCEQMTDAQLSEVRVEFVDGSKFDCGDLIVDGAVNVEFDGSVIQQISAQRVVSEWLSGFLSNQS